MKIALVLLLLAAPLTAQDRDISIVPAENIINIAGDSIFIQVDVMTDSAALANLNRNLEALRQQIADKQCNTCGSAPVTQKLALGIVGPLLLWIAISLHNSRNQDSVGESETTDKIPEHEHDEQDYGESDG